MTEPFQSIISLGLMSGTSVDGIDAAILVTDGESRLEPRGGVTIPYTEDMKSQLIEVATSELDEAEVEQLEMELTELHAEAVELVCKQSGVSLSEIDVIGCHGHTIRHQPEQGFTRQIANGWLLAELTGRTVVFDFRSADVAAGGQGAPLAPLYHRAVLAGRPGTHVVLNLGGVGNVTWIQGEQVVAGDTGPGCGLLDAWVREKTGESCDRDGKYARQGKIDQVAVDRALTSIPFFEKSFPKSADRYDFDAIDIALMTTEDGAATLCAITVQAVVEAVGRLDAWPDYCWVTGGGRHHPLIMSLLAEKFDPVAGVSELGHSEDFLEAECFAWLAVRRLRDLPASLPATTGVSAPQSGGVVARS